MRPRSFFAFLGVFLARCSWVAALFGLISFVSLIHPKLARGGAATPEFTERVLERLTRLRNRLRQQREEEITSLRAQLGQVLNCERIPVDLPLPEADDTLLFLFGIPVAPWLKRVGVQQWNQWIDHLGMTLRARYPERADLAPGEAWDEWVQRHVRYIEVHFARIAGQRIAQVLNSLPATGQGQVYLFGHSTGGAAVLQYLADLRDGLVPQPARQIRAALTMDAAVTGPARVWAGWPIANERPSRLDHIIPKFRRYLPLTPTRAKRWHHRISWSHTYVAAPFRGLGAWAADHQIGLASVTNMADAFSHAPLGDVPYVRLRIGRRFDIASILSGRTHLCVQRDPRVPPFIWWHEGIGLPQAAVPARASR